MNLNFRSLSPAVQVHPFLLIMLFTVAIAGGIAGFLRSSTMDRPAQLTTSEAKGTAAVEWFEKTQWGSLEEMRQCMEDGSDPDLIDPNGESALHVAVDMGDSEVAKLLIAYGADVNIQDAQEGFTPLMYAAFKNDTEMIKLLLSHGADPTTKDHEGFTVYHYLSYLQSTETLRLVSEIAPVPADLRTNAGESVADMVKLSGIKGAADANGKRDRDGQALRHQGHGQGRV